MSTILFLEDWYREENRHVIVDNQCKNESFIHYAGLLKSMGVKNHSFCLQLHDRELQGIDPYDYNSLTQEMMLAIAVECRVNPFFFFRSCVRVPGSTEEFPIFFRANRGNMALYWLFFNHIMTILIQIRQTGKSFSTDTLMTYLLNLGTTDTEINLLTKDDTLRSSNLERLKNIELELPFYLKMRTKADIGNTEELTVKSMGNRYRGHLPNKSPKLALNVGRGLTSPIFQIDEAAFFFNIAISMPAALAAGTAARDLAALKGLPYGTILTTTAGKKDDRDGAYVYNLVQEAAVWSEKFFDAKNNEELQQLIRNSSSKKKLMVNCTFNHRQLGYTDEWLRRAIEAANAVGEDAERDFGNVWTSGSQQSPLSIEIMETIRDSEVIEPYMEISSPYGYVTRWYTGKHGIEQRMSKGHYSLAIDSSDAAGGDDISLHLRDITTGETVASGNYNETNLITFAEWLCEWLVRFKNVTMIIERRSTGAMILDYLLLMLPSKGINPFLRIYNKVVQEADEFPERLKEVSRPVTQLSPEVFVKYKKLFGFATSATGATSRTDLYGTTFQNTAKMTGQYVRDTKLINQILSLIIKNGRIDHPPGGKDDLVIAWNLSYWLITLGKNLHVYGISSRDILVNNNLKQQENDPSKNYHDLEQQYLRTSIEKLLLELEGERDPYICYRIESKLRTLSQDLTEEDQQTLSLDNLLQNLKDKRKSNKFNRFSYY